MESIVVVDDDKVFRELLQTILKMEGYRTVASTAPEDVVPTVREADPVLVLMDVHIHNQDTLGALRELKGDESLREIPVVMTSGMDRADECLDAGADAFVLKPFRPSQMIEKITGLIESRERA
jgi:CheY-like chemotaxis protein